MRKPDDCPLERPPVPRRRHAVAAGVWLLLLTAAPWAAADEVRWRYDYNAARQEAQERGLPLLIDFSTEWCGPCKKLDLTTFRDPAIQRLLNEQFIPLKIDGTREKRLVDALRIQAYPTLIIAGSDGRIHRTIEGYVEAARLREHLQGVLQALANPEWMERSFQDASRAVAARDYARAVALLQTILQDNGQRPTQVQARLLLLDLEQQARTTLARARQLEDRGQYLEAVNVLSDLVTQYAGTQAAAEAATSLAALADKPEVKTQQRRQRAAELLAQAKSDFRAQHYLGCLERCEVLAKSYGDLPEGIEGGQLLAQIKANPEWMTAACQAMSDRLGELYLDLAETWVRKGEPKLAAECLQRTITLLPRTRHAELARTRLAQIQGLPAHQAGFEK